MLIHAYICFLNSLFGTKLTKTPKGVGNHYAHSHNIVDSNSEITLLSLVEKIRCLGLGGNLVFFNG